MSAPDGDSTAEAGSTDEPADENARGQKNGSPLGGSTVFSRAPLGLEAPQVRVEVHLGPGLPAFHMVGLPEAVVRESRERVRAALLTSRFRFPEGRITVNLSPADLPKEGGRFDLPIALGILAADKRLPPGCLEGREFYGELSLAGELRETPKLLPALVAGSRSGREVILPFANSLEASLVGHAKLKLAHNLSQVCEALEGRAVLCGAAGSTDLERNQDHAHTAGDSLSVDRATRGPTPIPDLAEVRGQFAGKRALEIAAAGEHGLLMIGPPGAGKTLLAQRLPGLLPPLSQSEALEVACLESAAGGRPESAGRRPFRSPQHTASMAALIGGGAMRPGELSLAHLGVLFLDELPEFARNALEALREPLESGVVKLNRLKRTVEFPARFQLVSAMNPCPCGYAGDPRGRCRCTGEQSARYRARISGPLVDRIDIHIELAALPVEHLVGEPPAQSETSAAVALRVAAARQLQMRRQGKLNARLSPPETALFCALGRDAKNLLSTAISRLGLSARAYHRVLKIARTCADLAGAPDIRKVDVAEAVQLRALDKPIC